MSNTIQTVAELRLVETPDDIRAVFPDRALDRRRNLWTIGPLFASLLPMMVGIGFDSGASVFAGLLLTMLMMSAMVVFLSPRLYQFIRITPHGLFVRPLALRQPIAQAVPIASVREGTDGRFALLGGQAEEAFLFGDTAAMGFTDYSLWFEDTHGGRSELLLESLSRADIQRLHATIEPMWRRARAGLTDTDASADEARGKLVSMAARTEG